MKNKIDKEKEKALAQGMDEQMIDNVLHEADSLELKTNDKSVVGQLDRIKKQEEERKLQEAIEKEEARSQKKSHGHSKSGHDDDYNEHSFE